MENIYIVYVSHQDIYIVKANTQKEAIDIVFNTEIKPFNEKLAKKGYLPPARIAMTAILIDNLIGDENCVCLT